jgi:uncharacterized protein
MVPDDMDRTGRVRQVIDDILRTQPDEEERRCGFIHLYGVAQACALLALKRGLDTQLSTIAGMLHDRWTYKTGDPTDHPRRGAPLALQALSDLRCFTESEIATISEAIAPHGTKGEMHGAYDEPLKDADVLQHHLYNTRLEPVETDENQRTRPAATLEELGVE